MENINIKSTVIFIISLKIHGTTKMIYIQDTVYSNWHELGNMTPPLSHCGLCCGQ